MSLTCGLLPLLVNLHEPVVLTVLVLSLVAPLGYPFALRLVVDQVAIAPLVLDTLLGGKALPLGRLLGCGNGLLTRYGCAWRGEYKVDTIGVGLDFAGGEQLVDEGLSSVARSG
jgi:hypothetical protein